MLRPLVGRRVQGLFHSPVRGSFHLSLTVLVRYLALRDGPRWFAQDFSCPALLRIPLGFRLNSHTGLSPSLAACSKAFCFKSSCHLVVLLPRWRRNTIGLGSSAFARHYLRNHFCFLLLRVLRCFSSPRSLPYAGMTGLLPAGLPHSDIRGSRVICTYPRLFAAYHVLLRLREPRHPPSALAYFLLPGTSCRIDSPSASCSTRFFCRATCQRSFFVENNGFEPLTLCLQSRCSSQLS